MSEWFPLIVAGACLLLGLYFNSAARYWRARLDQHRRDRAMRRARNRMFGDFTDWTTHE